MSYTREDIAYLAGLFDGEGCVQVYYMNYQKYPAWQARVCIGSTDGPVMNWLENTFGGFVHTSKRVKSQRIPYTWYLNGQPNKELLRELLPFLKIKKDEVEYFLEFLELINPRGRNSKITNHDERLELAADIKDCKYVERPYVIKGA